MDTNETLVSRVRAALAPVGRVDEKRMFGGLAFMVDGKMCVTVRGDRIMVRIDPDDHDRMVADGGGEPVEMRGRVMRGYVRVHASTLGSQEVFDEWMRRAIEYNPKAPRREGRKR